MPFGEPRGRSVHSRLFAAWLKMPNWLGVCHACPTRLWGPCQDAANVVLCLFTLSELADASCDSNDRWNDREDL